MLQHLIDYMLFAARQETVMVEKKRSLFLQEIFTFVCVTILGEKKS